MKNYILFFFGILMISLSSCSKENDPFLNEANEEWRAYCEDFAGGEVNYKINGKNWKSNCVQAAYTEVLEEDYGYDYKLVYIYAFNYDLTFKDNSDIEYVVIIHTEITTDGVTETTSSAVYYDGFFDYQKALNDPNYEVENIMIYSSDEYASNNIVNITEITTTAVKGNVNIELIEEEAGNETLTLTGSFNANLTE